MSIPPCIFALVISSKDTGYDNRNHSIHHPAPAGCSPPGPVEGTAGEVRPALRQGGVYAVRRAPNAQLPVRSLRRHPPPGGVQASHPDQVNPLEINLTQAYINHNAPIDHRRISEQVKAAQQDYQAKIEQKEAELKKAEDFLNAPCLSQQETTELRDLYRTIAKALHPDLHPDQGREECDLFIKAASAYRKGDIQTLRQISILIQTKNIQDIPGQDLLTLIEKAKESIAIFQERIDLMNAQFSFIYRDKILDPQWIKEQQEAMKERITNALNRLKELKDYLMMLKLWNPDSSN